MTQVHDDGLAEQATFDRVIDTYNLFSSLKHMKTITIKVKNHKPAHFWHFMMGEFLPIVSNIARTKPDKVTLFNPKRRWNAVFDKFYKELETKKTKIILKNNLGGLNKKKPNRQRRIRQLLRRRRNIKQNKLTMGYRKWDWQWNSIEKKKCKIAIKHLKKLSEKKYGSHKDGKTLCLYRDKIKGNLRKMFNNRNFGAGRRSFRDMDKINKIFQNVKYVNTDNMPILKQISFFTNHNKLILEHGAGMVLSLFMNNKSKVIELIQPWKAKKRNGAAQGLRRISNLKGYKLKRVIINNHRSILGKKKQLDVLSKKFMK